MFKKILIANRGEIACRVAATARRLGVKTVAVYSDADAQAKHVEACDEAVHIGGSAPKDSYLRWERILDAARSTGAEAVHPGYGFLSENEDFAQACANAGIAFIGPRPHSIRAMGLKAESKRLMEQAGVPLVPGYHGVDQEPALLAREADRIGYPVLIKASAGGGGKGMRVVERAQDFAAALASCQREAQSSFGSDAVLIEKYVQRPRHIEIQVFGDTQGQVVYLFERDCSVQRRHQKVLEEAPAPGMSESLRAQMGRAAVAAAQAVQYVGAGTVEFIVEQTAYDQPESMKFYFMEMNTRLQVEHPVTEAITGHDLVEWQLRVASGEPLPVPQEELRMHGHAIEARICAENPDKQFLPATGTLHVYRKPPASSFAVSALRFDDGVREGDSISPFYDSMIAKLIVHGRTREEALNRLNAALTQTHIVGVQNNVQFLRHVIASPSFTQARLDTALIERESSCLFDQQTLAAERAAEAVVAQLVRDQRAAAQAAPGAWADPWAEVGGQGAFARSWAVQTGDKTVIVREPVTALRKDAVVYAVPARPGHAQEDYVVFTPDGMRQVTVENPYAHAGDGEEASGTLTAPMPGKIVSFAVQAGDTVTAGQTLAVMEAMKMEHTICAPRDGVVAELLYAAGDQVADGAELLKLEAAA